MRNYCEYLQGNYFVLTEVVVVVISRETFHVLHHAVAYEMQYSLPPLAIAIIITVEINYIFIRIGL